MSPSIQPHQVRILVIPSCEVAPIDVLRGTETWRRLEHGLGYWNTGDFDLIAVTGGLYLPANVQQTPSGILMARCLERAGVPQQKLLVETGSRDTFENVSGLLQLCKQDPRTKDQVLVFTVVTHWQHAWRLWLTFRAWGHRVALHGLRYPIGPRFWMEWLFLLVHILDPRGTGWLASKNRRDRTQTD